ETRPSIRGCCAGGNGARTPPGEGRNRGTASPSASPPHRGHNGDIQGSFWQKQPCMSVRRAKVSFFSGCNSHLATVAPASSNRSGGGGNETAGAFDRQGRFRRFCEQAGQNVSERRAGLEKVKCGSRPSGHMGKA